MHAHASQSNTSLLHQSRGSHIHPAVRFLGEVHGQVCGGSKGRGGGLNIGKPGAIEGCRVHEINKIKMHKMSKVQNGGGQSFSKKGECQIYASKVNQNLGEKFLLGDGSTLPAPSENAVAHESSVVVARPRVYYSTPAPSTTVVVGGAGKAHPGPAGPGAVGISRRRARENDKHQQQYLYR